MGEAGTSSLTQAAQQAIIDGTVLAMELQQVADLAQDPRMAALFALMSKYVASETTLAHVVLKRQAEQEALVNQVADQIMARIERGERPWWRRWFS